MRGLPGRVAEHHETRRLAAATGHPQQQAHLQIGDPVLIEVSTVKARVACELRRTFGKLPGGQDIARFVRQRRARCSCIHRAPGRVRRLCYPPRRPLKNAQHDSTQTPAARPTSYRRPPRNWRSPRLRPSPGPISAAFSRSIPNDDRHDDRDAPKAPAERRQRPIVADAPDPSVVTPSADLRQPRSHRGPPSGAQNDVKSCSRRFSLENAPRPQGARRAPPPESPRSRSGAIGRASFSNTGIIRSTSASWGAARGAGSASVTVGIGIPCRTLGLNVCLNPRACPSRGHLNQTLSTPGFDGPITCARRILSFWRFSCATASLFMREKSGADKKPSLSLKATPPAGFARLRVHLAVDVKGGPNDYADFYCPTVQWDWDDGTISETSDDCEPVRSGKSTITPPVQRRPHLQAIRRLSV